MENTFFATLFRMKYISRWGLMRCNFGENLSEHSLEVAFLAHALALIGNQVFGKAYDWALSASKRCTTTRPKF